MTDKISKEQFDELCESYMWDSEAKFHKTLKKMTGITAKPYVVYSYYDADGMFIGDSNNSTLRDLLGNAYIKIDY